MKNVMLMASCAVLLMAASAAAQTDRGDGQATTQKETKATTAVKAEEPQSNPRFVRTLTNVQVELNLSDQIGNQPAEKKTVSMIVSSGNWGKIRSAATIMQLGEPPYPVQLNVDARPYVSTEGQVQLELVFEYIPVKGELKDSPRQKPSGLNQSQTVILQSGKPMVISQAADPVSDRKVIVEVKATVLK